MTTIEGWLHVPAERNLIGRAGTWKSRYVRFGAHSPTAATLGRSSGSPIRPTTATGVAGSGVVAVGSNGRLSQIPLERRPQAAGENSDAIESAQLPIYLTIYKQKNDIEPVARYPLTSIASCYIGDVASRHNKKKSVVLPTLIVNLRAEIQLSSSKSFRRRSHDVPPREGAKKEGAGREILYFRPAPDHDVAIERWSKEIQSYLIPTPQDPNTANANESEFRGEFSEPDPETQTSSPSLFFINGEPSTALLSPSLRSRASNLSSIESDDKGSVMSSSVSEFPSPRLDEDSPRSSGADGRPPLHVATKLRHSFGASTVSEIMDEGSVNAQVAPPSRRETILDRFFSSTAPSSPNMPTVPVQMNSIARFEALIRDIESGRESNPPDQSSVLMGQPKRIPSPTQRALEYVSTGLLKHASNDGTSLRPGLLYQGEPKPDIAPSINLSIESPSHSLSRQASETSLGTAASMTGSIGGGGGGGGGICGSAGGGTIEASLGVSNSKRHSVADFSMMRLSTTPPLFQLAASRRGSYSDIPRTSETYDDESSSLTPASGRDFGSHPRVTRPLFREFSF